MPGSAASNRRLAPAIRARFFGEPATGQLAATESGLLIHVKHAPKSSAVSHPIAQALVSTDALRHDNEAREKLRALTTESGGDASWVPDRLSSVMLAMARPEPITAEELFSFSQVTLGRLDSSLAEAGVTLTIGSVRRA